MTIAFNVAVSDATEQTSVKTTYQAVTPTHVENRAHGPGVAGDRRDGADGDGDGACARARARARPPRRFRDSRPPQDRARSRLRSIRRQSL